MGSVLKFTPKPTTDEYFGGCPRCGQNNGFINIGRDHWFLCTRHKTTWCVGSNLFSSWREEDEAIWEENSNKLAGYMEVTPMHRELTPEEREAEWKNKYESQVMGAFVAIIFRTKLFSPTPQTFESLIDPGEDKKNHIFFTIIGAGSGSLDRDEAYAAYEAMKSGDSEAIPTLLRAAGWVPAGLRLTAPNSSDAQ